MSDTKPAIVEAQKEIGAVLEELESKTNSDVKNIALEDVVDTDPQTGRPVVQKGVEITLNPRLSRKWAR
jgi:hypothetical protein